MSLPADVTPEKIVQLEKKLADTYAKLSNCYLEVENLKLQHKDVEIKLAQKTDACALKEQIGALNSAFDPIQKKILHLDDHKDMLQALVREIKNGYKDFSDVVKEHTVKIDDLYKAIEAVKALVQLARTDLDTNMNAAVQAAKKDIQIKMDALPIPRATVSPVEMKKHVDDVMEGIVLDAKNAFESSKNSEMRLDVLDKKIESILIKIKNVELKAQ